MLRVGVYPEVLSSTVVHDKCAGVTFTGVVIVGGPSYMVSGDTITEFLVRGLVIELVIVRCFFSMARYLTASCSILNFAVF